METEHLLWLAALDQQQINLFGDALGLWSDIEHKVTFTVLIGIYVSFLFYNKYQGLSTYKDKNILSILPHCFRGL